VLFIPSSPLTDGTPWELAYVNQFVLFTAPDNIRAPSEAGGTLQTSTPTPKLWCRFPDMGLPAPDLILFLDISPEQAKLRGGYWEERYKRETRNAGLGVAWVRSIYQRLGSEMQGETQKLGRGN
jgi:dTMP kinase